MGYSHYFSQNKDFTDKQWEAICKDAKIIIRDQKKAGVKFTTGNHLRTIINKNSHVLNLNGYEDNQYETFLIKKKIHEDRGFCKTNQKNYDLTVMAILLLVHHHAPCTLNITSSGKSAQWEIGSELNYDLFKYAYRFPASLTKNDTEGFEEVENNIHARFLKNEKEKLENILPKKLNEKKPVKAKL